MMPNQISAKVIRSDGRGLDVSQESGNRITSKTNRSEWFCTGGSQSVHGADLNFMPLFGFITMRYVISITIKAVETLCQQ